MIDLARPLKIRLTQIQMRRGHGLHGAAIMALRRGANRALCEAPKRFRSGNHSLASS